MVKENVPLSAYTTMGVGGCARKAVFASTVAELADAAEAGGVVLGRGSNIVAADSGYDGTVVFVRADGIRLTLDGVYAEAGATLAALAAFCRRQGLSGLEWAAGIPGTVGGAAVMNAGAFGGDFASAVLYVDTLGGRLEKAACGFGYRTSAIESAVLGACFAVSPDTPAAIGARIEKFATVRRATQPQGKSAGSVFRAAGLPAAVYIDRAGLKGTRVGGALVSEKHANFIVNTGGATAADVRALVKHIQQTVRARYGVQLIEEIRYLGDF